MPRPAGTAVHPAFALLLGCAVTLCVGGYQFGQSNHTVYLLDALHGVRPDLLANDWFTTRTLQYHAAFGLLTRGLMRLGVVRPAFLIGYLALVAVFHSTWLRLTLRVGGDAAAYLLAVVLFYLSAAGFGLGVYSFFQDSAMLPSNLANVALLAGLLAWCERRRAAAGVWLGVAGLFHLNDAALVLLLWPGLLIWDAIDARRRAAHAFTSGSSGRRGPPPGRDVTLGSAAAVGLSLLNMLPAARAVLAPRAGGLPLREFVDLYVRLRHPHHYDPSSWPVALWASFLWPVPFAAVAFAQWSRSPSTDPATRAARRWVMRSAAVFALLVGVALVGAGVWYVSETLVQMSLYRFSIYLKLLTCTATAWLAFQGRRDRGRLALAAVCGAAALGMLVAVAGSFAQAGAALAAVVAPRREMLLVLATLLVAAGAAAWVPARRARGFAAVASLAAVFIVALAWNGLGLAAIPEDPPAYLALCAWASNPSNVPADAVLLVPPEEQSMRLIGQRAIVVDYKGVPQLASELPEWRDRMCATLDLPDLNGLPRGFDRTLAAIAARYESLSAARLEGAARRYGARYVVVGHPLAGEAARQVYPPAHENGPWLLYDLAR